MADRLNRKFPDGSLRITSGCQYCAVGCGYNAFLVSDGAVCTDSDPDREGVARFITPAMRGKVTYKGDTYEAAVAPDARCDLNKGNHSVRGGSQGLNLVSPSKVVGNQDQRNRSTKDRLTFPKVRLNDGCWHKITWETLNEVMAKLVVHATEMAVEDEKINVAYPERLGVKIFEYQYLENTYAATKLFYSAIGTPNVAYHDRPGAAGSSPGLKDVGMRPHDFSYEEVLQSDILIFIGTNPYENQSVFFMQYAVAREMIVIDPRKTPTAQYAASTGGVHLQPKTLGADSLVLFAICREMVKRWLKEGKPLQAFPWRDSVMEQAAVDALKAAVNETAGGDPDEFTFKQMRNRRRASRAMGFDEFVHDFLKVGDESSDYTLCNASEKSGIGVQELEQVVDRIFRHQENDAGNQPKVGLIYEKGMIWGFNYHNTASVGALGIMLGAGRELGRFVGRVGGHQKGWAESLDNLSELFVSTKWEYDDDSQGRRCKETDYAEGYPFRNAEDYYSDEFLDEFNPDSCFEKKLPVHHNLDNHVFGPPRDFLADDQSDLEEGYVRLKNGLETKKEPDVHLLWIIGCNFFGQTNDAQRKRAELEKRRAKGSADLNAVCPEPPPPGERLSAGDIVPVFTRRMDKDGIVLIHQELFANPTTELCDIVIPASGWGEEAFCRYNAQRRLKLYDQFQDSPIDKDEIEIEGDPAKSRDRFLFSPKPDWLIIRDVARAIGREFGSKFASSLRAAFPWNNSAEVADSMAEYSHRGLEGEKQSGNKSMLGDLLPFGIARGVEKGGKLHSVLGASDGTKDAKSEHLASAGDGPHYVVYDPHFDNDHLTDPAAAGRKDPIQSNGIATNGVLLPVEYDPAASELRGTWRVQRWRNDPKKQFCFIKAPFDDIAPYIAEFAPKQGELFITNGRFNHLWNNMFHHLRNDYVNERYPEDLPGTILEVNPRWANQKSLKNGQIVEIVSGEYRFHAVLSKQSSVPENGAFAMFSYPVRENGTGKYQFDGYVNNVSHRYADGINPIGALKYGKAVVDGVENPNGGGPWIYPRDFPNLAERAGPTFEERNRIVDLNDDDLPYEFDFEDDVKGRLAWTAKETIVTMGLPRSSIENHVSFELDLFQNPYNGIKLLDDLGQQGPAEFISKLRDTMEWPDAKPYWDKWRAHEIRLLEDFLRAAAGNHSSGGTTPIPGGSPADQMLALITARSADAAGAFAHSLVPVDNTNLRQLFADVELARILEFLQAGEFQGQRLVVPGDADNSLFFRLVSNHQGQPGPMFDAFTDTERAIVRNWIEDMANSDPANGTPEQAVLQLIEAKRPGAMNSFTHGNIPVGNTNLRQLFVDEEYAAILEFLKQESLQNQRLIAPGDPNNSLFLQLISAGGPMETAFTDAERSVVRDWINSLSNN